MTTALISGRWFSNDNTSNFSVSDQFHIRKQSNQQVSKNNRYLVKVVQSFLRFREGVHADPYQDSLPPDQFLVFSNMPQPNSAVADTGEKRQHNTMWYMQDGAMKDCENIEFVSENVFDNTYEIKFDFFLQGDSLRHHNNQPHSVFFNDKIEGDYTTIVSFDYDIVLNIVPLEDE